MSSNQNSYSNNSQKTNSVISYGQPTNNGYSNQQTNGAYSNQRTNGAYSNQQTNNDGWKLTRLTAKPEPTTYDPRFDYDSLQ